MSNKTIPLRRVQRRRHFKKKAVQLLNTILMLQQLNKKYQKAPTAIHFPSGGFPTRREEINPFDGYLKKIKEAVGIEESSIAQVDRGEWIINPSIDLEYSNI